jgi:hypothetical protein
VSRSLRRGTLAATALAFSLASLAACSAGNNAQTLGVKPDSAAATIDDITIQNAVVVTPDRTDPEGPAVVTGTLFNNGAAKQTLDSITLPGTSATVKLSPAKGSGPVTVPAGGWVQLGGKGHASAVIDNGRESAIDGDAQQVVFTFSETGDVGLRALVFPATGYREGVGPSATPTATGTPTPTGTPQQPGEPTGTDSGAPDGSSTPDDSSTPTDSASASVNVTG